MTENRYEFLAYCGQFPLGFQAAARSRKSLAGSELSGDQPGKKLQRADSFRFVQASGLGVDREQPTEKKTRPRD